MKIYSCLYILGVGYHILGSLDSKSLKTLQKKKKKSYENKFMKMPKVVQKPGEANLPVPDLNNALVGKNSANIW